MLKIAVFDDDIYHNKKLVAYINKYTKENKTEIRIEFYTNEKKFLETFINRKFDLVLLDVSMFELTGFKTVNKIRQIDAKVTIIFCTICYDFNNAQKGLRIEVENFLKKPLSYKEIEKILNRLNSKKMINSEDKFVLKKQDGIVVIQISDIIFLEIERKSVIIHMRNKSILCYLTLRELENRLGREYFYRCHKSYVINLDYVEGLENNCLVLRGIENKQIPVSKGKREGFLKILAEYMI